MLTDAETKVKNMQGRNYNLFFPTVFSEDQRSAFYEGKHGYLEISSDELAIRVEAVLKQVRNLSCSVIWLGFSKLPKIYA
jgi:hypothetical protein